MQTLFKPLTTFYHSKYVLNNKQVTEYLSCSVVDNFWGRQGGGTHFQFWMQCHYCNICATCVIMKHLSLFLFLPISLPSSNFCITFLYWIEVKVIGDEYNFKPVYTVESWCLEMPGSLEIVLWSLHNFFYHDYAW